MFTTITNYPILQPAIALLQHVLTDYSADSVIIPNFGVLLDTLLSLSTKKWILSYFYLDWEWHQKRWREVKMSPLPHCRLQLWSLWLSWHCQAHPHHSMHLVLVNSQLFLKWQCQKSKKKKRNLRNSSLKTKTQTGLPTLLKLNIYAK